MMLRKEVKGSGQMEKKTGPRKEPAKQRVQRTRKRNTQQGTRKFQGGSTYGV